MQRSSAFGTVASECGSVGKLCGAVIAPGRCYGLDKPRKSRACYINGWTRSWLSGPVIPVSLEPGVRAFGVHIPPLFIPTITVHGELIDSLKLVQESFYANAPGCFINL